MNSFSKHSAKHLYNVYFGGNWTSVNYKQVLSEIDWKQATKKTKDQNTIAELVFHTNYFIAGVSQVLKGGKLEIRDKFSFDGPEISSEKDWTALIEKSLEDARVFSELIERLPESKLMEPFVEEKYGNYFSNIHGIIEHCHYHLGQIVLLRKMMD
ncbi:MAG: DUF1572 domain-containing protein [Bacteroidota bacterium]